MIPWPSLRAVVSGDPERLLPLVAALHHAGSSVVVVSEQPVGESVHALADAVLTSPDQLEHAPDVVVLASPPSPGVAALLASGVPAWCDPELAWRLRQAGASADARWIVVADGPARETAAAMTTAILSAEGLSALRVGASGHAVTDAVTDRVSTDVLVVEVQDWQWPHLHTVSPVASAVLAMDEHGQRAAAYERTQRAALYVPARPETEAALEQADVVEGCRAIGVTTGIPAPSMIGMVEDLIVDRAFLEQRRDSALPLAGLADLGSTSDEVLMAALTAAGLTRALDVRPASVALGLRVASGLTASTG